jgi:uncharacterized membrane protein YeaQ/YmgE (transglycosylase-associated protein family)
MTVLVWFVMGTLGGWLYGKLRKSAMGELGDALLGLGGGLAGGVLFTGFGLGGPFLGLFTGAAGGAAMVALIGALKDQRPR